jgi:hypothetical protein
VSLCCLQALLRNVYMMEGARVEEAQLLARYVRR